jgi:hypothetical protein
MLMTNLCLSRQRGGDKDWHCRYVARSAILVHIVVTAATLLYLLEFVAAFLRLAAVLTVAVNCFAEIFLGLVDTLIALVVVTTCLRARRDARQQQYC